MSPEDTPMPRNPSPLRPVRLDLTPEEHGCLRDAAHLTGVSMSAYARRAVVETCRRDLRKAGRRKR